MELLVAIALIGILATLIVPEIGPLRERAEKVVCMGHLRSLHCALGSYLNDYEQWPQCPEDADTRAEETFWLDALKDYGGTEDVWRCPSTVRLFANDANNPNAEVPRLHYTPTQFDELPLTPRKWGSMPWLIEISDAHHGGNLLIRTDGSVLSVTEARGGTQAQPAD